MNKYKLYEQLNSPRKQNIQQIYDKAISKFYCFSNWPNWIDHSVNHISNVLENLNGLIPNEVLQKIESEEAFILLAGCVLHDIGMQAEGVFSAADIKNIEDAKLNVEIYNKIRQEHGKLGAEKCRKSFSDIINNNDSLDRICDIIKNHHGEFNPDKRCIGISNFHAGNALLVRLADGLDFGPERAPGWLFDYLKIEGEQRKYWMQHLKMEKPVIDNRLFRIMISGKVDNDDFLVTLKENFHQSFHYQKEFFTRGFSDNNIHCYYIIWDQTTTKRIGIDPLKVSRRPIFRKENYLIASRYLYNLAQYEAAIEVFDDVVDGGEKWIDYPNNIYLYHYFQSHNKLGQFDKTVKLFNNIDYSSFDQTKQGDLYVSVGIAYLRLGEYVEALLSFSRAINNYQQNENNNLINLADTCVWNGIVFLELIKQENKEKYEHELEDEIEKADNHYEEYKNSHCEENEVHYKGRYFGLRAFYNLYRIEKSNNTIELWGETINFAQKAYGGAKFSDRVPFGIMCGKYAETVVFYRKFYYSKEHLDIDQCVNSAIFTIRAYKKIYNIKKIPYYTEKVENMAFAVYHVSKNNELKKLCEELQFNLDVNNSDLDLFTPLN